MSEETLAGVHRSRACFANFPETAEDLVGKNREMARQHTADEDDEWDTDAFRQRWSSEDLEGAEWDHNPLNPTHDPNENSRIDVFGPGDEAETMDWNTD